MMEYDGVQSKKAPSPPSAMKKVVDYIAGEIYGGRLKAGDRLPTEAEL